MSRAGHITDELPHKLMDLGADILLLQEPYALNAVPVSLGPHVKILTANNCDQYPWAAIAVANPNITALNIKSLGSDNVVVLEISVETSTFYAMSAYLSPNKANDKTLYILSRAAGRLRGSSIIMGINANANLVS